MLISAHFGISSLLRGCSEQQKTVKKTAKFVSILACSVSLGLPRSCIWPNCQRRVGPCCTDSLAECLNLPAKYGLGVKSSKVLTFLEYIWYFAQGGYRKSGYAGPPRSCFTTRTGRFVGETLARSCGWKGATCSRRHPARDTRASQDSQGHLRANPIPL